MMKKKIDKNFYFETILSGFYIGSEVEWDYSIDTKVNR